MVESWKLGALNANSNVEIDDLGDAAYWVRFNDRSWIVWTDPVQWVEVAVDDRPRLVGEMHFGSIAVFYQKCIEESSRLPANHGKKWVENDVKQLFELIDADASAESAAEALGRSVGSILAKTGGLLGMDFGYIDVSSSLTKLPLKSLRSRNVLQLKK